MRRVGSFSTKSISMHVCELSARLQLAGVFRCDGAKIASASREVRHFLLQQDVVATFEADRLIRKR